MSAECGNCQRATRGDRVLCPDCITKVDECLTSLFSRRPDRINVLDELQTTMTRQSRLSDPLGTRGGAETPLAFHALAAARYNALFLFLRHAARDQRVHLRTDSASVFVTRVETPYAYAAWLRRLWPQRVKSPESVEFAVTLLRLNAEAWVVIDRPPGEWYAGRCPTCNADMYAVEDAATVKCRSCRETTDVAAQRERLLAAVDDVLATAAEISRAVHITGTEVTPSRITNLYHRGKLVRYGRNRTGDHLYRMGDVLAVVRAQQSRLTG